MEKLVTFATMALATTTLVGCDGRQQAETPWIVDRFDDVKVIRYEVPGFDSLSLREKELVYYLAEAAKSGRDILFDQNFRLNLPIRRTLETVYEHYRGDRTDAQWLALEKYLKKVWFANGIHHHYSNDKFVPEFSEEYLRAAIAAIPAERFGELAEMRDEVCAAIFDPQLYPSRLNQKAGDDLLLTSAGNYYRTGDLKLFDRYNILWVKDTVSNVDFVNGFIEDYGDPLGRKASWEGNVNFMDREACHRTEVISKNAQWFEDHSPVDPAYKKKQVRGVSAKVITVAMLGGDCYPATPIGINLPNADWIRKEHGSKSVTIDNITYAYKRAAQGDGSLEEFVLRAEDRDRMVRFGKLGDDLHTDLHECLGHGSGQLAPGVKGGELRSYGSTLEEARADLFALYYLGDPKLVELGLVPSFDVAKAQYASYVMNGLMTQLSRIEPGKNIEEAHMRNRKMIAEWCYEQGRDERVIERIVENGKTYFVVNDFEKLRELFGRMLCEMQRIKSEGDYDAGAAMVERYAVQVEPELHREVLERYAALDIAPYGGFVNPEYELVEQDGRVVDVKIVYPNDYAGQMLHYSKDYSFLPNRN